MLGVQSLLSLRLCNHLISAAKQVHIVNVDRAQIHLESIKHRLQRNAQKHRPLPVDIQIKLRYLNPKAGVQTSQRGVFSGFVQRSLQATKKRFKTLTAAIFDLQFEPAGRTQPQNRWGREHSHEAFINTGKGCIQPSGNGTGAQFGRRPLIKIIQRQEHNAAVGTVGEAINRQPRKGDRISHAVYSKGKLLHLINHRNSSI